MTAERVLAQRIAGRRYFYGWNIVAVAFLANMASAFQLSSTFGVFYKPMAQEIFWSRTAFSALRSIEQIFQGLVAPFLGGLLDKRGARDIMVVGALLAGGALIALSQAKGLWDIYLIRVLFFTTGMLFIGNMTTNIAISNWFIKRRGRATGFSNTGTSLAKVFIAPVATLLIAAVGWRATWALFGTLTWLMVVLPAALLMRRRPEDMGLRPDGEGEHGGEAVGGKAIVETMRASLEGEVRWTRREALKTRALWLIVITFGVASVGIAGLNLHLIPYLTDEGFSPQVAAFALSATAFSQLVGTLAWGFIVERIDVRYAAMSKFLLQAGGLALLTASVGVASVFLSLCVYGFGGSGSIVIQDVIWANYFGRRSLGAVRSLGMPMTTLLSALGPLFFGYLYDLNQSYKGSFTYFTLALFFSAFLILWCKPPEKVRRVIPG